MARDSNRKASYSQSKERSIIQEYLRSGECLIEHSSSDYDDFWRFYTLYRRKVELAEGIEHLADSLLPLSVEDTRTESRKADDSPAQYSIHWQCPLTVQRRIRDKRDARQQKQHEQEQKQAESRVARHIIAAFLHFRQKTTFAKLKKLSDAQKNLPIYAFKEEILQTIENNSVVIVAGDTGCGKSTQLPRYLLQHGYKSIVCTQPRRLACVSLCQRVAYETLQQYGDQIGYQIRFERRRTEATRVVFMTEGLLLRQVSADPMLLGYDVIVLDEVHERHLQGDFLLGVVKCLALQRPNLRVILMSATINLHLFQDYFNGKAPIIQIPGRLYPIELVYQPISAMERTTRSSRLNPAPYVRILSLIDHKYSHAERGDLLIFLSGVKEIGIVAEACQEYAQEHGHWIVLALHSSLAVAEQDKVFAIAPDGVRKCIISTNIAETSVTIDGVRFVVDSGRVKEMTFDSSSCMQRLKEFWVSQASAEQRKGRAGRTGPGVCYRLYSHAEFELLAPFSRPEVERVPLHSLVLQTAAMGLADVRKFPFIDRPEQHALEAAIQQLNKQGALTLDERLTPLGHMLASLPVDVGVGAMLVTGALLGPAVGPTLTVAAALSVQSPWTHRAHRSPECLLKVKELLSSHGDPVTLLELFGAWLDMKVTQRIRTRRWCVDRGIEEQRLFEIVKLRRQFVTILEEAKLLPKPARLTTSKDRIRRHGQILQLRRAKRKLTQHSAAASARVLRVPSAADGLLSGDADDTEEVGNDLGTVDLMMNADERELKELLNSSRLESFRDLTMLKIIICRGLYPNFAVPDLHNSYKCNADLVFHATSRPFVILHPNSALAYTPDVLQVCDSDIVSSDGHQMAGQAAIRPARHSSVANTHQMLAFVTLLETTKPYVTNVVRVPTLQTMMLFSSRIDTSLNCTVLCCDQWLEFMIDSAESAQQLLARAINLRNTWLKLLQLHFNESESSDEFETEDISTMRANLVSGLIEFLHTDVFYSYRRLVPGDLQEIYLHLPEDKQQQISSETGRKDGATGLPDYLHYNVLVSDDTVRVDECVCPYCDSTISCVPLDRLLHWIQCSSSPSPPSSSQADSINYSDKIKPESNENEPDASSIVSNTSELSQRPAGNFYCENCQCWLTLSGIEVLRHQRAHDDDASTQ